MEKAVEEGSKKGSFLVGNAEGYINEFVMPVNSMRNGHEEREDLDLVKKSLDELERLWGDARRVAEEKEGQVRKVIKRNRKLAGLAH